MKALTLTQPWASAIAMGFKRIETRSWQTPYRGPLAIHAAKGLGPVGGERGFRELIRNRYPVIFPVTAHRLCQGEEVWDWFPRGAIVATCELVHCERITDGWPAGMTPTERKLGNYEPGRFAWLLAGVASVEPPVFCSGALGLWDLPDEGAGGELKARGRAIA